MLGVENGDLNIQVHLGWGFFFAFSGRRFLAAVGFFFATRCFGPLLIAASTARSKRCHASGSDSISDFSLEVFAMPIDLPGVSPEILQLTKLDVARSQLKTAIRLWFRDGDP